MRDDPRKTRAGWRPVSQPSERSERSGRSGPAKRLHGDTYWTCHESPDGLFCERVFVGVKGEEGRGEEKVKRRVKSGKIKER